MSAAATQGGHNKCETANASLYSSSYATECTTLVKSCQRSPRRWTSDWIIEHIVAILRWGRRGAIAPLNLGVVPKYFQHIGAKRSGLWHSKYAKMPFRQGPEGPNSAWGAHNAAPYSLIRWGGDTILPLSALATKIRRIRRLGLAWGTLPSNIFL